MSSSKLNKKDKNVCKILLSNKQRNKLDLIQKNSFKYKFQKIKFRDNLMLIIEMVTP